MVLQVQICGRVGRCRGFEGSLARVGLLLFSAVVELELRGLCCVGGERELVLRPSDNDRSEHEAGKGPAGFARGEGAAPLDRG